MRRLAADRQTRPGHALARVAPHDLDLLPRHREDFRRDARSFARRYGLTFPLAYDGPGKTLARFGVTGFPETFVVDKEGVIRYKQIGPITADALQQTILPLVRKLQQS